jgi:branched-subunit amino acid ABC-type transport system permease component
MDLLRLAIAGLPAGGMYALAALGIVVIYRATGTLNLAQGAIATSSAFVFNWAWVEHDVPLGLAVALAVGLSAVLGLALDRLMRLVGPGNVLAQVIATLGVQGLILYACARAFGLDAKIVPSYLPSGTVTFAGVSLSYEQLIVVAIAAALAAALGLFLTRTEVGTAIRAVSQNRLAGQLSGLHVARLQALSWMGGSVLAGLAGVLLAPLLFVDTGRLSLFFLVKPFAAAVVGGLASLPLAFGAGLGIGMAEGMLAKYTFLPGLPETVPFLMILAALILRRNFRLTHAASALSAAPSRRPGSGHLWPGVLVFVGLVAVVPSLDAAQTITFRLGVAASLLALSVVVLTGWVGQISLAQGAFFGIGSFMAATLANRADLPFPVVILLAPLCVVPVAVVVGLPALRFRGLLLAVVTLAFGALCSASLFKWRTFTGGEAGLDGSTFPAPQILGYDLSVGHRYTYLMLAVAGLVFLGIRNLARYRAGGPLFGVRESEEGAAALGVRVTGTKLLAFGLSGAIAGLGGSLMGYSLGFVSGDLFTPVLSITIFAVIVVAGLESLWGAALAGVIYAVPSGSSVQLLSSVLVIVTLVLLPGGLVELPRRAEALLSSRRPQAQKAHGVLAEAAR